MEQAIQESLKLNKIEESFENYEPLQIDERARTANEPVGLKNIGNTCYFNSLLQTLFRIPSFVEPLLNTNTTYLQNMPVPSSATVARRLRYSG